MNIKEAIQWAIEGQSHLTAQCLEYPGMSSARNRHLLNHLCTNKRYLEVGTFKGSTLLAACYDNGAVGVGVDNSSQFGDWRTLVYETIAKFGLNAEYIEADYRETVEKKEKYNVIFYDGCHKNESTREALEILWPMVAEGGALIVDDYCINLPGLDVQGTTDAFIAENKIKATLLKVNTREDKNTWWNGLAILEK